jgi:type I restriction enzyme R subunit
MSERPFSDTSERGLERLICTALTGAPCDPGVSANGVQERPSTYAAGWICGAAEDYDREYCVDLAQLAAFLRETQPEVYEALDIGQDGPTRRKFLARLQGEISKRGTIDVLRHGLKHGPHHIDVFYGTPSLGNARAAERYVANRFSVTRPLRYSRDETQRALDPAGPVPLPDLRRQVPDRLRRAAAAHDVRGQAALGHQGGADAVAPESRAPEEA